MFELGKGLLCLVFLAPGCDVPCVCITRIALKWLQSRQAECAGESITAGVFPQPTSAGASLESGRAYCIANLRKLTEQGVPFTLERLECGCESFPCCCHFLQFSLRLGGRPIGRTPDSGSGYPGSSPGLPAKFHRIGRRPVTDFRILPKLQIELIWGDFKQLLIL